MDTPLEAIERDFAACIELADSLQPQATNSRSKESYQPGIGPHSEAQTVELVAEAMRRRAPTVYDGRLVTGVSYPELSRQRCDLCIGLSPDWEWAIEVKMLRMLGDNGKANDNILMHILSPYPTHRSALTDCTKLVLSQLRGRRAILIYGYEHADWPLEPAIAAFESLARERVRMGKRHAAPFGGLIHPIHSSGMVFGWEIEAKSISPGT